VVLLRRNKRSNQYRSDPLTIRRLLGGLAVLHTAMARIHRDVKPENVLLASSGRVKVRFHSAIVCQALLHQTS
jgi:serine/threonine protein kinase